MSRLWNAVATPLVYERVVISNRSSDRGAEYQEKRRQLDALLHTVSQCASDLQEGTDKVCHRSATRIPLGPLVRRLDLALPKVHHKSLNHPELSSLSRTLADLVKRLPSLEVFVVWDRSTIDPLVTFDALSPVLKHLRWCTDQVCQESIPLSRFLAFLECHDNLETIDVDFKLDHDVQESAVPLRNEKVFPSIEHWVFQSNQKDVISNLPSGIFPSLEAVRFPSSQHPLNSGTNDQLLKAHGQNLTSIRISPRHRLGEMLQAMDLLCPRLREIHIDCIPFMSRLAMPRTIDKTGAAIRMPQVATLGLQLFSHCPDRLGLPWYKFIELRWKDIFPNLQRIRLLEETDVDALDKIPEEFAKIVEHSRSYGIELEDHFGRPLAIDALESWLYLT